MFFHFVVICNNALLRTSLYSWKQGEVELGNGLPDIRSMGQCLEALKVAGFEVSSMVMVVSLFHISPCLNFKIQIFLCNYERSIHLMFC